MCLPKHFSESLFLYLLTLEWCTLQECSRNGFHALLRVLMEKFGGTGEEVTTAKNFVLFGVYLEVLELGGRASHFVASLSKSLYQLVHNALATGGESRNLRQRCCNV